MKRLFLMLLVALSVGLTGAFAQGKFSGLMFGDYFYNVARDTSFRHAGQPLAAVGGQKDLQAFQFRRIYFTYDDDISEHFTTRFRLEADGSALTANGKITTFVKDAFLRWKNVFTGSDLVFGIQPSSAYDISETQWGYRALEKTIMDLRSIVPSRELGISLKGKLVESGMINYWLTFSNNSTSTSIPNGTTQNDKYKRYSLNVQLTPVEKLMITLYGSLLGRPNVNDPRSTTTPKATLSNNLFNAALFVNYQEKDHYNLGVEAFMSSLANAIPNADTTAPEAATTIGFTVFGTVNLTPELVAIVRFDYFDLNSDSRYKGDQRNYVIVGLAYKPDARVQIIPNVQFETYQSVTNGPSIDASVTGRVTFYYIFL
jgi:hypothetical protein